MVQVFLDASEEEALYHTTNDIEQTFARQIHRESSKKNYREGRYTIEIIEPSLSHSFTARLGSLLRK